MNGNKIKKEDLRLQMAFNHFVGRLRSYRPERIVEVFPQACASAKKQQNKIISRVKQKGHFA